ncbi:MAG TPA: hypothetical protein VK993_05245 [Chthoniobacterales bacterium]|nr:hypothetical protein [Chthoniobacterales bacterium]
MSDCCSGESSSPAQASGGSFVLCPNCRQPGRPVTAVTLKHMVQPEFLQAADKPGFLFCRTSDCVIVYFRSDGEALEKSDLRVRVGLKETADPVPVCYCFGFTERMLLEEIEETGQTTIPERIAAEMKADHCACEVRNPQGSCCFGNVKAAAKRAQQIARPAPEAVHPIVAAAHEENPTNTL